MMIFSLCNTCLQPYTVLVEASDVELIKQIADDMGHTCPCPRLCGGRINLVGDPLISEMTKDRRLKESMTLSGKELYQAVNGLGLPDEIPKTIEVVAAMLKSSPIEHLDVEEQQGKIFLHEILLQNGVTIHLGSGQFGAQVLKMTKERTPNGTGNPR